MSDEQQYLEVGGHRFPLFVDDRVPPGHIYIMNLKPSQPLQKESPMSRKFLLGVAERVLFSLAQAYVALAVADVSYDRAFLVALGSSALLSLAKSIVSRGVGNPNDGSIIP